MDDYKFAISIASEAGRTMRKYFRNDHNKKNWKSDDTPVTIADKEINDFVANEVLNKYPSYGFIGEEGGAHHDESAYVWVCDPIDGTRSFARGIPAATFSLALVKDGEPILGVIYQPFLDEMYVAKKGGGALCNGKKIQVSTIEKLGRDVITACPSHRINAPFSLEAKLLALANQGVNTYNYGSAAYNAVLVARGSAEGTIFPWSHCWDMAAAKIIIEEAGGKTSNLYGDHQKYNQTINGFVGSNHILHENFIMQRT